MRNVTDHSSPVAWRGAAAFVLDNFVPLLGFTAFVIGAFHLPGVWGAVGGWMVAGAALVYTRYLLTDDIAALRARATADRIDRERARVHTQRAAVKAVA